MRTLDTITTAKAADVLGVTTRAIARMVERGDLEPLAQAPGPRGAFFFDPAEVERARRVREVAKHGADAVPDEMGTPSILPRIGVQP